MTNEVGDGTDDLDAIRAAVNDAVNEAGEPPGELEWNAVVRAAWFGVDHDPDAPPPRDIVDQALHGIPTINTQTSAVAASCRAHARPVRPALTGPTGGSPAGTPLPSARRPARARPGKPP
jgi:hypothetical protein